MPTGDSATTERNQTSSYAKIWGIFRFVVCYYRRLGIDVV